MLLPAGMFAFTLNSPTLLIAERMAAAAGSGHALTVTKSSKWLFAHQ